MPGIGLTASLLMGARSLTTQRVAIEVSGHNLANVNTPNAARQRVNILQDITVQMVSSGSQGLGSYAESIQSVRSELLDKQVIRQESLSGYYETRYDMSSLVEDTLGENFTTTESEAVTGSDSLTGFQNSLNQMFDAWQALATEPTSTVLREQVITRASNVADDLADIYQRTVDLREGMFEEAAATTREINSLSSQIASLNEEIARIEVVTTKPANDLRDRRQELVEQLSNIVNIQVAYHSSNDKMLDISMADNTAIKLVSGVFGGGEGNATDITHALSVDATYNTATNNSLLIRATPNIGVASVLSDSQPSEGTLGAYVYSANDLIGAGTGTDPDTFLGQLNQLALNIRTVINTQHNLGRDMNGNLPANNFFDTDPAQPEALGLTVHSSYIADSDLIAAADATLAGANPLDGSNAYKLADLRNDSNINSYHRSIVSKLGVAMEQAERDHEGQKLIAAQLLQQREAVSGISMDEEMSNMILFQRAYEASARFVSIVDGMMETVLNMKR